LAAGTGPAGAGESEAGARDDVYSTPFQTPLVLNAPEPTANDQSEPGADFEDSEILSQPANGTLSAPNGDPVDGVTYTPNPGFTGVDEFQYVFIYGFDFTVEQVDEPNPVECNEFGAAVVCQSVATVTITVEAPPPTTTTVPPTTTTVTVAAVPTTTTSTTVAPAATLPVTGRSSRPLLFAGAGVVLLGGGALVLVRRRSLRG
jgi:LPXTG-motif cell wall-anchored protein